MRKFPSIVDIFYKDVSE